MYFVVYFRYTYYNFNERPIQFLISANTMITNFIFSSHISPTFLFFFFIKFISTIPLAANLVHPFDPCKKKLGRGNCKFDQVIKNVIRIAYLIHFHCIIEKKISVGILFFIFSHDSFRSFNNCNFTQQISCNYIISFFGMTTLCTLKKY